MAIEFEKATIEKAGNTMFVQMSNHKVPEIMEVRGKPWIYYGKENDYPDYLINLFNRSAKHNAIVTGKKEYITGKGFDINPAGLTTENLAITDQFLKEANPDDTLDDILEKAALDLEIFGGFCLQIIYTRGTRKIASIYHIDFSKIRVGNLDPNFKTDDKIFDYYFSNDWTTPWTKQSLEKTGLRGFDAYNPERKIGTQILYFKEYRPKMEVYPLPDYIGCIPYIEVDYEIANFHLNNIKNGFWGNFLINFANGIPTDEEKADIEAQMKRKFSGSDNAGRFIVNFSDGTVNAPDIKTLQMPDLDKQFTALDESCQQNIFTGHKITSPMLFGIKTAGQLGGRDEISSASELFQNTYVNHKQQLLSNVFNDLLAQNGVTNSPLFIVRFDCISTYVDPKYAVTAMTRNEVRQFSPYNLPQIEDDPTADTLPPPVQITLPKTPLRKQSGMSDKEKALLEKFRSRGRSRTEVQCYLKSKPCKSMFHALQFDDLQDKNDILDIIKRIPKIQASDIAKKLKLPIETVQGVIADLVVKGLIGKDNVIKEPPDKGKTRVIQNVFAYDLRDGVDGDVLLPTSRDFCVEMIEMDKMYTIQDIREITAEEGYDVLLYCGGFWHDSDTGKTYEHCRHQFFQHTITTEI